MTALREIDETTPVEVLSIIDDYKTQFETVLKFKRFLSNILMIDEEYISDSMMSIAMKTHDEWKIYEEIFNGPKYYIFMLFRVLNSKRNFDTLKNYVWLNSENMLISYYDYILDSDYHPHHFSMWINGLTNFFTPEFEEFLTDLPDRIGWRE